MVAQGRASVNGESDFSHRHWAKKYDLQIIVDMYELARHLFS